MWTGYGLSRGVFVIFASSKRGFVSLTCCLVINSFCWWSACIYSASQQSMRVPFWHACNNCSVFCFVPYSCLFSKMCVAYADFALFVLIYLIHSLYLTFIVLPDCLTYTPLHVLHFNLYIQHGSLYVYFSVSCCCIVLLAWKVTFRSVFLNRMFTHLISGLKWMNITHFLCGAVFSLLLLLFPGFVSRILILFWGCVSCQQGKHCFSLL
jgi:hypothetical protein